MEMSGTQITKDERGTAETDDNIVRISRFRAGGTHFLVSVGLATLALSLVFGVWYPSPMDELQGVSKLLLVLIGVDVSIGPLITTLIFNPAKGWRLLRFDLMVIVAFQSAAFLYGMNAIFSGRPAYLVFSIDRFDLVQAQEIDRKSLEKAEAAGQPGMPWWGPRTVASRKPSNYSEQQDLLFSSISGGADLPQLPHLFVPYADDKVQVLSKLHPLGELKELNKLDDREWSKVLETVGRPVSEVGYVPLMGKQEEGAVVVDARTAEIVCILTLLPKWDLSPKTEPVPDQKPAGSDAHDAKPPSSDLGHDAGATTPALALHSSRRAAAGQ